MAYRGSIPMGSRVDVELQVGGAALGSALLAVSCADNGGGTSTDSQSVAPQGSGRCGVQTGVGVTGLLRVWVDFHGKDRGRLTTYVNGRLHDDAAIEGDTTWAYSLS